MLYYTLSVLLHVLYVCSEQHKHPTVEASSGLIRGHYKHSYGGRTFSAFEGIPYAKPPVGNLRFKDPESAEPWLGIWNATTEHECIQLNTRTSQIIGNEDCLYLNIYVPRNNPIPNENLDVIVYIHGGAFMFANPAMGGPEYLMDRDIVYVSINYRLGLLGFLSTADDVVPGNSGMKDQVLALKWIQNNIEQFGGNPKSVTLLGLSAGGAAVHMHYLSRISKGLFHRGISQSGTALVPWAIQEAPLEKAKQLAILVGCEHPSTAEFVKCLQQRPARHLVQYTADFFAYYDFPLAPFAPVVEKQSDTAFLTKTPYEMLSNGNVNDLPWITSVAKDEGIFPVITLLNKLDDINKHWNEALPHLLEYNYTVIESEKAVIAQKIKEFYLGNQEVSHDNIQELIKLFGDRYFILDFEKAARMQAKVSKSSVYSYIYGYKGEQSLSSVFNVNKSYGVGHGEDGFLLHYAALFETIIKKEKLLASDELIKEVLLDIVTSFAKTGIPRTKSTSWKPVTTSNDFEYLFIREPCNIEMVSKREVAPTEFWHSLPILENENIVKVKDEL